MHKTSSKDMAAKEGQVEKLEVTIIPVDDEPYSKVITYPASLLSKYHRLVLYIITKAFTTESIAMGGNATHH